MSLWFNCTSAAAQAPELGGLLPSGGPRAETTSVRIEGKNLKGARLQLGGPGLFVKAVEPSADGNSITASIVVDNSATLGPHDVRITTPKGISNGARFWVDSRPNFVLSAGGAESAAPVELDGSGQSVVNGCIGKKAGRDRFAFTAAAGETWSFDCFADRIRSRLDPVLEIQDINGVSVRLAESTWENDPRFSHTFKKAGRYLLTVRDSEYNGGPSFVYRLSAGRQPLVISTTPLGGQPGATVELTLRGSGLGSRHVQVAIPRDTAAGARWEPASLPAAPSNLLPLLVSKEPVYSATDSTAVQPLPAIPACVDGAFGRFSRAQFRFHATAKRRFEFDLLGRRIGSRIDGELRIVDATGKEVAANDDMSVLSKDARLEFSPPADGDYTVQVRNVEEITGDDCFYRLVVREINPDFRVSIATDQVSIPAGSTISIPVTAERVGGFSGPIEVKAEGLPGGVTCSGGTIPANRTSVEITVTAPRDGPKPDGMSVSEVRIVGRASIGGSLVVREAPGWQKYEHRSIDLLLSVEYSYARPFHLWDMVLCSVGDRVDSVSVGTSGAAFVISAGGKLEIPVHLDRLADGAAEVKLEVRNLPDKITATAPTIPAGKSDGMIVLTAAADTPVDLTNVIVAAKYGNSTALAPAIRLAVKR